MQHDAYLCVARALTKRLSYSETLESQCHTCERRSHMCKFLPTLRYARNTPKSGNIAPQCLSLPPERARRMHITAWSREPLHQMTEGGPLGPHTHWPERRPERRGGAHGGAPPRGSAAAAALSGALTTAVTAVWAAVALLAAPAAAAASTPAAIHGCLSHFRRPAESPHRREGRNEIRTAEGRVRREEMGAKQGLAAGSWWEQRQGSGRWRGGLQQQQQAALGGVARAGFEGGIPETRPESPLKDKPAARRPPAGLGTSVPTPRAGRAALASPEDRAVE